MKTVQTTVLDPLKVAEAENLYDIKINVMEVVLKDKQEKPSDWASRDLL